MLAIIARVKRLASNAVLPLVIGIVILGAVQSTLKVAFPTVTALTLLDDVALALTCVALVISRFRKVPYVAWVSALLWAVVLSASAARATVGLGSTLEIVRQLLVPVALVLIGFALVPREWRALAKATVWVAAANGAYACIEIMFGRILDPGPMASSTDRKPHGIPASYFWWDASGDEHVRAGGLALNPPVAGIIIAAGLILGCYLSRHWWQYGLTFLLVVPLILTNSRAGMLIAIAGVLGLALLRHFGLVLSIVLGAVGAAVGYTYFSKHGDSLSHVRGLTEALREIPNSPFGAPIGTHGNIASRTTGAHVGESLVGLGLASTGFIGCALVLFLAGALIFCLIRGTVAPIAATMALGLLCAALVSESVSALNGTVALWASCGYALANKDTRMRITLWPALLSINHLPRSRRKNPESSLVKNT